MRVVRNTGRPLQPLPLRLFVCRARVSRTVSPPSSGGIEPGGRGFHRKHHTRGSSSQRKHPAHVKMLKQQNLDARIFHRTSSIRWPLTWARPQKKINASLQPSGARWYFPFAGVCSGVMLGVLDNSRENARRSQSLDTAYFYFALPVVLTGMCGRRYWLSRFCSVE